MASFNVTLNNAKFYNATKLDIVKGQIFYVELIGFEGEHRFASFHDRLLEIEDTTVVVKVEALEVGSTEIQVQTTDRATPLWLEVTIVDSIELPSAPATAINSEFKAPQPK